MHTSSFVVHFRLEHGQEISHRVITRSSLPPLAGNRHAIHLGQSSRFFILKTIILDLNSCTQCKLRRESQYNVVAPGQLCHTTVLKNACVAACRPHKAQLYFVIKKKY
uniref:Uncharacterized protein n=1 Tax=Anguilla anguilla TaxID=7936 RepID=A0A0E9WV26_ANGAN